MAPRLRALSALLAAPLALGGIAPAGAARQGAPAAAQARPAAPAQARPTFEVQSGLVVVDCVVRDRKGNLVRDLGRDDFTVYEDGVPQSIVTFAVEEVPAAAAEPPAPAVPAAVPVPPEPAARPAPGRAEPPPLEPEETRNRRLMILLFDLSSLTTEDLARSVTTAEEFVERKAGPSDLIAVATYSSTLQLAQPFTADRDQLIAILKKINPTEAGDAAETELGDAPNADDTFVPDDVQFNIFNTDRRLSALETLAKAYREIPERKSLIYFSSGMATTGVENQSQIRSTVDSANQANLSIYTVDSRGLQALPPGGGASAASPGGRGMFSGAALRNQTDTLTSSQETLVTLAHDTGGTAFTDSNDLAPVFDRVVRDTESYYILGYTSTNAKEDGRFRKIRVEVRRPGLKIQHRPGYFAAKQFLRLTRVERERQLEEAFNVDRPFADVPFILQADYFKQDAAACAVPVSLQLAGDGVQFEEKGTRREAEIEFLARITDSKGKVAGVARDVVDVKLPLEKAERVRSGQIVYSTGFELRPGSYVLKFLMRDNRSGKLGTFESPLSIPALDGKSLQTSSIVLGSRLVDTRASSAGVEHRNLARRFEMESLGRDPMAFGGKRVVPSIGNVFLARQTAYVYFEVYGAAEDPATRKPRLETHLLFLDGRRKVLESAPLVVHDWAKGVATVAMAVPLRGLKKGSYGLQIHVRDDVSDTNLFRRVPLVVN